MIRITRTRHDGVVQSKDSTDVPRLVALRSLCLGDIKWGALVAVATPQRIETTDFSTGTTMRVVYEPVAGLDEMSQLLKAASAVAERTKEDAESRIAGRRREYRRQQDDPHGGIMMAMTGLGQGAAGRQKARKALMSTFDALSSEQASRMERLEPEAVFAVVALRGSVASNEEALVRVEEVDSLCGRRSHDDVFRFIIDLAQAPNVSMIAALDVASACLKAGVFVGWAKEVIDECSTEVSLEDAVRIVGERHRIAESVSLPRSWWRQFIDDVCSMRWARHLRWGH